MAAKEKTETQAAKIFPHNFEAEQSVLCCLLIDGNAASKYVGKLSPEAFYNEKHRHIYQTMRELNDESESIDVITVSDKMIKNGTGNEKTLEYLTDLTNLLPSAANCGNYVKILHRDMILRNIIEKCNKIIENAYVSTNEEETLRLAEKEIYGISNELQKNGLEPISKAATDLIERLNQLSKDKNAFRGLPTGFAHFDKITNGLQKGDLIILAARPSVGKTAFALNIVNNIIRRKNDPKTVAIYSLEMPAVQLAQRMLCDLANVPMDEVNSGELSPSSHEHLWELTKTLSNSRVFVNDSSMISPNDVAGQCRRLCGSGLGFNKIDLIVVDYLGLMSLHADNKPSDDRQLEIATMSRQMKGLAKEFNCPIILLCQMSRGIENRKEKTPQLSDLRESGAIEQDADIVLFLSREDEAAKHDSPILLDISKHRNGELGQIRLTFDGKHMRFTESNDQSKYAIKPAQSQGTNAQMD